MERVLDVAQHIFDMYRKISGSVIDEMKLHKLLYFAQRESFAIINQPLFLEKMEGWRYGPVSREVRLNYTPDGIAVRTSPISNESAYIVNNVIAQYAPIETWELSRQTHRESSWQNARRGLAPSENGAVALALEDIAEDAKKVRPYDSLWDMYYDEFEDAGSTVQ